MANRASIFLVSTGFKAFDLLNTLTTNTPFSEHYVECYGSSRLDIEASALKCVATDNMRLYPMEEST